MEAMNTIFELLELAVMISAVSLYRIKPEDGPSPPANLCTVLILLSASMFFDYARSWHSTKLIHITMLISRGTCIFKNIVSRVATRKTVQNVVPSRNSHASYFYRDIPDPAKGDIIVAELCGGFMWWWILWHMYHDFGHIVGEFPYPDPSKWTDEELGIPPED